MSDLVDANELARRLKVTPATIHAWHRRGWIPCLRAGHRPVLFDVADVEQALRDRGKRHAVGRPSVAVGREAPG
jgi:DNA-binding transcriptional MerR regulator